MLVGGGTIAGRVHRDRELAAGPIVVRARCIEAWREAPPRVPIVPANRSMRMPRWHERTLWSEEVVLDGLADAHWAAFAFTLPPELPPAVEARSVAWRYEIEARRPLRLRPDERAIAVPLGYRAMLLEPGPAGAAAARVSERRPPRRPRSASIAPPTPTSAAGRAIPPRRVEAILAATGAAPGRTLLELGAGTGKLTRELAGSGARVIALEPVAGMRERARADGAGSRAARRRRRGHSARATRASTP